MLRRLLIVDECRSGAVNPFEYPQPKNEKRSGVVGGGNEIASDPDQGDDTRRDLSRVIAALSTVPSSMAGMKIAFGQRDGGQAAMDVARGLGVGFGGPTAVHLMGTFAINNFGGLGGGL